MKVYVLLIGVNRYEAGIGALTCAAKDARKLESVFDHKYGFTTRYLEEDTLHGGVVEDALEQAGKALSGGGVFIFYFSGHGKQQGDNQLMLLPGAKKVLLDRGNAQSSGVFSYQTLRDLTNGWKNVRRLFIFDACRSLLATKDGEIHPAFEGIGVKRDPGLTNKLEWEAEHDFTELNSCGPGQVSLELPESKGGPGHGVFTLALLEMLNTAFSSKHPVRVDDGFMSDLRQRMWMIAKEHGEKLFGEPTLYGEPVTLWEGQESANKTETQQLINDLDDRLWKLACLEDTIEAYKAHLDNERYSCVHVDDALTRIGELSRKPGGNEPAAAQKKRKQEAAAACARAETERQENEAFAAKWKAAEEAEAAKLRKEKENADQLALRSAPGPSDTYTDPVTGMEFVYVQGGCFQMGDTLGEWTKGVKPVHEVCVDNFWIGKYEVTQGEWEKVMKNNPSRFPKGPRYPVERVSWEDAQTFIKNLNSQSGRAYRLPTEAEWEYAARERGRKVRFGTGKDSIGPEEANFDASAAYKKDYSRTGIYRGGTTPVGTFAPNSLGLHDMSGNVREWCSDWYGEEYYGSSSPDNPQGPSSGEGRVVRGGGWGSKPQYARSANRGLADPGDRSSGSLGFRLVLPPDH